jgi:quercetin dioxygenase-like cupin family protein
MDNEHNRTNISNFTDKPSKLDGLVNVQAGTVVSRTIIEKKGGTVTLFAFAQGQGLSEHTAPFDALVYLVDGEAEVTISGKPHRLKRGELIIMPANEPHALKAITEFKMLLVMTRS